MEVMDLEKSERIEATNNLEYLFENNCRVCPARDKEHTRSDLCKMCPVLPMIQREGMKFGGPDKRFNITKEQFAIAEANGIKKATVESRFYHLKWSIEKSITHPLFKKKRKGQNK